LFVAEATALHLNATSFASLALHISGHLTETTHLQLKFLFPLNSRANFDHLLPAARRIHLGRLMHIGHSNFTVAAFASSPGQLNITFDNGGHSNDDVLRYWKSSSERNEQQFWVEPFVRNDSFPCFVASDAATECRSNSSLLMSAARFQQDSLLWREFGLVLDLDSPRFELSVCSDFFTCLPMRKTSLSSSNNRFSFIPPADMFPLQTFRFKLQTSAPIRIMPTVHFGDPCSKFLISEKCGRESVAKSLAVTCSSTAQQQQVNTPQCSCMHPFVGPLCNSRDLCLSPIIGKNNNYTMKDHCEKSGQRCTTVADRPQCECNQPAVPFWNESALCCQGLPLNASFGDGWTPQSDRSMVARTFTGGQTPFYSFVIDGGEFTSNHFAKK
jgi:hypothetical protein